MERHLEIDKEKKRYHQIIITKGNMLKYFEQRRIKRQKKWGAEFDKAFKEIMREEKIK